MSRTRNLLIVSAVAGALALTAVITLHRDPAPSTSRPRTPERVHAPRAAADQPTTSATADVPPADVAPADVPKKPAHKRAKYHQFAQKNASDVLEVLVLQEGKAVPDLRVRVRPATHGEMFERLEPADDDRVAFTNGDGLARFDKVLPSQYMIGVETRDNQLFTTYQLVRAEKETPRQIVALGKASISGHVFDRDGKPMLDSRVMVTLWDPPSGATRLFAATRTNGQGAYTVANLPRGKGRVYSELKRSIDFALDEAQAARADFGSSEAPVSWTGCLQTRSGATFGGIDSVVASQSADGEGYVIKIDDKGRFATRLPPGEYRVWLPSEPPVELGKAVLEGRAVALDLAVPGVTLGGVMKYVGAHSSAGGEPKLVELSVQRAGDDESRRTRNVAVGERYMFAGLEAGKWVINTRPLPLLGAQAKGLEVTLDGSRDRVALDVLVTDP
jgi:hypothetical protein